MCKWHSRRFSGGYAIFDPFWRIRPAWGEYMCFAFLNLHKGRVGVEKMRQVDKTLKISIGTGLTDPAERREPCHTRKISI